MMIKKHSWKNSVWMKMFIQMLSIIIFCGACITLFNVLFLDKFYYSNIKHELKSTCEQVCKLYLENDADLEMALENIESRTSIHVKIIDAGNRIEYANYLDGKSVQQSHSTSEFLSSDPSKPGKIFLYQLLSERYESGNDGGVFEVRHKMPGGMSFIVYIKYLDGGSRIEVSHKLESIKRSAELTNQMLVPVVAVCVALSALWAYFSSKRMMKPLIAMSDITHQMSELNFSKKCDVRTDDELGSLAKSINSLSDTLDSTLKDLKSKNKELEQDIAHERQIEQKRKEFISSVSHELKTPISIIQGYAEGLKIGVSENDAEMTEKYCDVIIDESQKMNKLVIELLELSQYESGTATLELDTINLRDFVESIVSVYMIRFKDKNLTCTVDIDSSFYGIADSQKLDRVIKNFLSNALSHTPENGQVKITCGEINDCYRISVYNSGSHIPDGDIDEIWNSFYRADKSRNRDSSRFGLGLSIVKAIAKKHSTACGAENTDDGVVFWFDVKKAGYDVTE